MGKFSAVFVATVQYAAGLYIFKKPDLTGCGPWLSSMVVLLALFLVLWSLPLYPSRLRKLVTMGNCVAQFLVAVFTTEYAMGCFWFPLEAAVLALLPKMATSMEDTLRSLDVGCIFFCDLLKKEGTGIFVSYLLSFLILVAALHASRVINLRLFSSGCKPFFFDVTRRAKKFFKSYSTTMGLRSFRPQRSRKAEYCTTDDDTFEFDQVEMPPTTDTEYTYH